MYINIKDSEHWPITLGPANLYARDMVCVVTKNGDDIIAHAKGHPYIDLRKGQSNINVNQETLYADIPRPVLWPEIILTGSSSQDFQYSFKENKMFVEIKWTN